MSEFWEFREEYEFDNPDAGWTPCRVLAWHSNGYATVVPIRYIPHNRVEAMSYGLPDQRPRRVAYQFMRGPK